MSPTPERRRGALAVPALLVLLVAAVLVSLGVGAFPMDLATVLRVAIARLGGTLPDDLAREAAILGAIRLPRVLAAALAGAALGAAGAGLQGLFRTPLVEPGLVGVAAGSAIAAVALTPFTLGLAVLVGDLGAHLVILAATAGCGVAAAVLLVTVSNRRGQPSVLTMLLVGIALNALATAVISVIVFANPNTAQVEATFWLLGSLAGTGWVDTAVLAAAVVIAGLVLYLRAPHLDAAVLGPTAARSMGVDVRALRRQVVGAVAVATAAATAVGGVIGFVGLVAPLLLRPLVGARHRPLVIASGLAGGVLVVVGDAVARTVFAPTELPVGVLMAALGAPLFLVALLREQREGRL